MTRRGRALAVGGLAAAALLAVPVSWGLLAKEGGGAAGEGRAGAQPGQDEGGHPLWARSGRCDACHTEEDWRAIVSPAPGAFDHAATGFPLEGHHAGLACDACHGGGLERLAQSCASCHHDPHAGQYSQSCDRCHTARDWEVPRNFFLHERTRFPLTGAHAALSCDACHRPARLEPLAAAPTDCAACHGRELRAAQPNHIAAGFTRCAQCHSTSDFAGARYVHRNYRLAGAHAAASCTDCHAGAAFQGLAAAGQDCLSCHQAEFASTASLPAVPDHTIGAPFGSDCGRCHDAVEPPVTFRGATIR